MRNQLLWFAGLASKENYLQTELFTKPSAPRKPVTNQVFTGSTCFVFTRTGWFAKICAVLGREMFSCLEGAAVSAEPFGHTSLPRDSGDGAGWKGEAGARWGSGTGPPRDGDGRWQRQEGWRQGAAGPALGGGKGELSPKSRQALGWGSQPGGVRSPPQPAAGAWHPRPAGGWMGASGDGGQTSGRTHWK